MIITLYRYLYLSARNSPIDEISVLLTLYY